MTNRKAAPAAAAAPRPQEGLQLLRRPHRAHRLQRCCPPAQICVRAREDHSPPRHRHLRLPSARADGGHQARAPYGPDAVCKRLSCAFSTANKRPPANGVGGGPFLFYARFALGLCGPGVRGGAAALCARQGPACALRPGLARARRGVRGVPLAAHPHQNAQRKHPCQGRGARKIQPACPSAPAATAPQSAQRGTPKQTTPRWPTPPAAFQWPAYSFAWQTRTSA